MENSKLIVTSPSLEFEVLNGTESSSNQQLDSGNSSSENRDPESSGFNAATDNPSELKADEESETSSNAGSHVLTDIVTFTHLKNKGNKEYEERCRYCSKFFTNPVECLRHKRTHFNKIILPLEVIENYYDYPNRTYCPICKEKLKSRNFRSIFIKHLLTHTAHTSFNYTCVVCKRKFKRKDHMSAHQKRHVVPFDMVFEN